MISLTNKQKLKKEITEVLITRLKNNVTNKKRVGEIAQTVIQTLSLAQTPERIEQSLQELVIRFHELDIVSARHKEFKTNLAYTYSQHFIAECIKSKNYHLAKEVVDFAIKGELHPLVIRKEE